jgi:predicted RNase H-like nuclease (RuvC/YqgF family)
MVMAMKGMADVLDNGITKLKNELKKKDERIRELEAKLEEKKEIKIEKWEDDHLTPLMGAVKDGYGMEVH